jgi:hypothetical protein
VEVTASPMAAPKLSNTKATAVAIRAAEFPPLRNGALASLAAAALPVLPERVNSERWRTSIGRPPILPRRFCVQLWVLASDTYGRSVPAGEASHRDVAALNVGVPAHRQDA